MPDLDTSADAGKRKPTPINQAGEAGNGPANGAGPVDNPPPGPEDEDDEAPIDSDRIVEVRILRNHVDYAANTIELVTEAEAKSGHGDWCDAHEDAVAYIKSLAA
jgi:hypothetical protein